MPAGEIPDFDIRINGAPLPPEARGDVRGITVEEDVDALSMVSLELYNWDDENRKVSWSDRSLFAIGSAMRISLGYVDAVEEVMLAEVIGLEPVFGADQPPMLTVRGYDLRHRLTRGRRTRTFAKLTDSAIAAQIAREAGLRAEVKDSKVKQTHVVQSNQTDLEFLQRRAQLLGWECYVKHKVLHFTPPQNDLKAAITLSLDDDITEFAPRLSALGQVGDVSVRGWDEQKKAAVVGQARVGQENAVMGAKSSGPRTANRAFGKAAVTGVREPVRSKVVADQIAQGQFNEMALTYIQGDVTCVGRADLRAGQVVDIAGAGDTFSGPYYVRSVIHRLTADNKFETSLRVRRNGA